MTTFLRKLLCYGQKIDECQKWKERIEISKVVKFKFEVPGKFIWQVEFSEIWKMLLESNVLVSNNVFLTNLILLKVQTVIKSHYLMLGASNMAILIFSTCFFDFWHLLSYSPYFYQKWVTWWLSCNGPITVIYWRTHKGWLSWGFTNLGDVRGEHHATGRFK